MLLQLDGTHKSVGSNVTAIGRHAQQSVGSNVTAIGRHAQVCG